MSLSRTKSTAAAIALTLTAAQHAHPDTELRFNVTLIDDTPLAMTGIDLGPDGHIYTAQHGGKIYRHQIDPATGLPTGDREFLFNSALFPPTEETMLGFQFDPNATPNNLQLWVSYSDNERDTNPFAGAIGRITLPPVGSSDPPLFKEFINGLPVQPFPGDHLVNQLTFGPDGRMYFNVGSQSPAGNNELPLSAATLVADVNHPDFLGPGDTPITVNTSTGYDPDAPNAKVTIYAEGLRNSYDLAWHSNGELYASINANDEIASTPLDPEQPGTAVTPRPPEQLSIIRPGGYYGHPNPSRGKYISHGGNPTAAVDPWEIPQYPVGTTPEPQWDPTLNFNLVNTVTTTALSPTGIVEYTANTPLKGRLLVTYFLGGGQKIQTFRLDDTGRVDLSEPLLDHNGELIHFENPLDLVVEPTSGRIYVAGWDEGNLYMLQPLSPIPEPTTLTLLALPLILLTPKRTHLITLRH